MLLAIETSGTGFSLALADAAGRHVVARRQAVGLKPAVSSLLLPALGAMFADVSNGPRALTRIGVSVGPGSFTGLRLGLTLAKTLAHELKIPLVAVPTLLACAVHAAGAEAPSGVPLIVARDARRRQVYGAIYLRDAHAPESAGRGPYWRTLLAPVCLDLPEFAMRVEDTMVNARSVGAMLCVDPAVAGAVAAEGGLASIGARRVLEGDYWPGAEAVASLCAVAGDCLQPVDPATLEPLYIRPPDATPKGAAPRE